MAVDQNALDQALSRELANLRPLDATLHFRLGDAFLPVGTAPPSDSRLRCCTCGFGTSTAIAPAPCPLCGSHAWELLPTFAAREAG